MSHQLSPNAEEAVSIFALFISRVSDLEKRCCNCSNLLSQFQHQLEKIRRRPLDETSSVVAALLDSNNSLRVARYREAGCQHIYFNQQAVAKLNAFMKQLENHIQQAQEDVAALQILVQKITTLMDLDLNSIIRESCAFFHDEIHEEEQMQSPASVLRTTDYALIMSSMLHMMEQDLQMQEMVVGDLSLDIDAERLQGYCHMWALRPFVDESLFRQALSWVGK